MSWCAKKRVLLQCGLHCIKCRNSFEESYIQVLYHATFDRLDTYTPMFICHSLGHMFLITTLEDI